MDPRGASGETGVPAGLCDSCRHARDVVSGKGSRFVLCELSRTDRRFPRYPQLPVLACAGYEPREPVPPGRATGFHSG
jgi:hypothetical protein